MGEHVRAGDLDICTEQVGEGPDVLLIGGLGDTVESWQFQLDGLRDRYRLIAFDNRGAGRTEMPDGPLSVEVMADDAAGSPGAQHQRRRSWCRFVHRFADVAPSERAFLEDFYLWIYTARAHNDGTVDRIIEEVLAFPHKQSNQDVQRFLDALIDHDTSDRLQQVSAPTLVLAGGRDMTARPELCRGVAELIPGARFEVMEEESHQPFQEVADEWNARVDAFWREGGVGLSSTWHREIAPSNASWDKHGATAMRDYQHWPVSVLR